MRITPYYCEVCGTHYNFIGVGRQPTKCPECAGALHSHDSTHHQNRKNLWPRELLASR